MEKEPSRSVRIDSAGRTSATFIPCVSPEPGTRERLRRALPLPAFRRLCHRDCSVSRLGQHQPTPVETLADRDGCRCCRRLLGDDNSPECSMEGRVQPLVGRDQQITSECRGADELRVLPHWPGRGERRARASREGSSSIPPESTSRSRMASPMPVAAISNRRSWNSVQPWSSTPSR